MRRKRATEAPEVSRDRGLLRVLLRSAGAAAGVAGRLGADPAACRAILEARLRIDMRTGGLRNPQNPDKGGLWISCFMFLVMGLMIAAAVALLEPDATRSMAAVQGFFMVMLGMLLVSDYLPSLIDPAEAYLLAPRPVSGRTLLLARVAHFVLYMAVPVLCLLLPSWLVGFTRDDTLLWMLTFPVLSMLSGVLVMSALMIVFLILLQRLDGERLSAVLLRAQMVASFAVFGGYYLGLGLIMNDTVNAWIREDHAQQALIPPYWFGGLYGVLAGRQDVLAYALLSLAAVVPVASLWLMLRLAGPRLATGLASLNHGGGDVVVRRGMISRWAQRLVLPGLEQAGFDVFLALSRREKGFRSRVYPLLMVPFVMFLWSALSPHGGGGQTIFLSGSVLPVIYGIMILLQVRFSDTPDAAWLYAASPMERPGLFVSGVIKGVAFAFLLPWMVVVLVAAKVMEEQAPLMDIVFGGLFAVCLLLLVARRIAVTAFPFSRQFTAKQAQSTGLMLLGFLLVGVMAAVMHGVQLLPAGQEFGALLLLPVIWWQAQSLRRLRMDADTLPAG